MRRQGTFTRRVGAARQTKRSARRGWRWWRNLSKPKKFLLIGGPILGFLIITPILTYLYYFNDIGNVDRLMNRNNTGVVLQDRSGKTFFSSDGRAEHRRMVPLREISDTMEEALIAAEDKDFYKHSGFSFFSIVRAMYTNIVARGIAGGGSTLTQQLAKNTLLTNQQTFLRKYQELTIATAIEQRYTKEQILEMYLNSVFYGENAFGIEDAAKTYFNKSPADLTLAESSMLVGVLPAPSVYSPVSGNTDYAKQRQTTVLTRMVANGYITEAEKEVALAVELVYAPPQDGINNSAPHFTEMVLSELYKKYGEETVQRSGYQVRTTLDLSLQDGANKAVTSGVAHLQANGGSNASLIAIDPKTGGIRALVGSADYGNEQWGKVNMVTTARQPGSSFKPIYYADALATGKITPTTVLKDEPIDIAGYKPLNADRRFRGDVTVRQALSWSLNIPAVKVMQTEGIATAVQAANKLGINEVRSTNQYGLALALGSVEVPLVTMTNAYAAFANQGTQHETTTIETIADKYSKTIYTSRPVSKQAISAGGAYLISNILSDNQARARVFGNTLTVTGTDGRTKNVAVKTGTTDDARDAWTIGYTPDIAVGVWTGNNDNAAMRSGGADMAGPIWRAMMRQAIGASSPNFSQPSGIVKQSVCTPIGNFTDVFIVGNVPTSCKQETKPKCTVAGKTELDADDPNCAVAKCTVPGKESLDATNPNCKKDVCTIPGKEAFSADDPRCVDEDDDETTDADGDGVADSADVCPGTPSGTTVGETGCPVVTPPTNSTTPRTTRP